ncbi:MAG: DUF3570 domain-containing protein [Rhodocyclaceae bacterium]|nr:DUF3570 domain-containing protein [Rhodocyclaceae bacterium]
MTSREHPLTSLFAAAMALPIVAIPVVVNAQTTGQSNAQPSTSSSLLPAGAVVGVRSLWYREDGDRMKVTEPVVWMKTPIGEQWEIGGSATVDMVSGASPIITSNATGKPAQIYTGASITDRRKAYDANVTRKYGELNENTVGVSFARSDEKDYESKAYGLNTTFDFNERNTTLALGIGSRNDRVMSVTDRTLNRARDAKEVLVGVTQIIDRRTLVQSNLVYTKLTGYLNDPYKLTFSLYRDGLSPRIASVRDSRPESRSQIAWLTRGKRALTGMDAVVSAEYRFYRDDWGIRSHTLAGTWLQTINETWQVEGGLRYYSQSQADFYRREITQRPIPTISSSDQRLAGFGAFEPSIKVIAKVGDHVSVDLSFSRYMQRGTWKLGGSQGEYDPLSARLINAGLLYRF